MGTWKVHLKLQEDKWDIWGQKQMGGSVQCCTCVEDYSDCFNFLGGIESNKQALAGVAQWIERRPANQRIAG